MGGVAREMLARLAALRGWGWRMDKWRCGGEVGGHAWRR